MHAPSVLADHAEVAIRACVGNTALVAGTGEEAEVARLVLHLPAELVKEWQLLLAAGKLDVSGWFTHKTPKARFTDPRTKRRRGPELCDLVLLVDIHDPTGTQRRALVIQAKTANAGAAHGEFTIAAGGPELQRVLYAHWPPFQLTGLPKRLRGHDLVITPKPPGTCAGTRYACVNTAAAPPESGWWLEKRQAPIPTSGVYRGAERATVRLGEALRQVIEGSLGATVTAGSDWERVINHVMGVARARDKKQMQPPDVISRAASATLPHTTSASLFLTDGRSFMQTLKTTNFTGWREMLCVGDDEPPFDGRPLLDINGDRPGFGVLRVSLHSPVWREEGSAVPRARPPNE